MQDTIFISLLNLSLNLTFCLINSQISHRNEHIYKPFLLTLFTIDSGRLFFEDFISCVELLALAFLTLMEVLFTAAALPAPR